MEVLFSILESANLVLNRQGIIQEVKFVHPELDSIFHRGDAITDLLDPKFLSDWGEIQRLLITEKQSVAFVAPLKDGRQYYVLAASAEEAIHTIWISLHNVYNYAAPDIAIFRKVFDALPIDVVIFDKHHRYLYANATAFRDPKIRQWVIGKTDFEWVQYRGRPQQLAELRHRYFRIAVEGKRPVEWIEELEDRRTGQLRTYRRHFFPMLNQQNEVEFVVAYAFEITDLVAQRKQLEDINQQMQDILQSIPDPLVVLDEQQKLLLFNAAAFALFDIPSAQPYTMPFEEIIQNSPLLVRYKEQFAELLKEVAEGDDSKSMRIEIPLPEQTGRKVKVYQVLATKGSRLQQHRGEERYILLFRDITEEYEKTLQIQESEERYRNLVEMSPLPILIHAEGQIQYCNPAAAKAFGAQSPDELLGRNVYDFVHPDSREIARKRITSVYTEYQYAPIIEEKLLRLDGSSFYALVSGTPGKWKGQPASQVVFYDITAQKELLQMVEQQRNMLESILETAPVGVAVLDLDWQIIVINEAACRILGASKEQLLHQRIWMDPEGQLQRLLKMVIDEKQTHTGECVYTSFHGDRSFYTRFWASVILDRNGAVQNIVLALEDFTERKRLEDQLRELNEQLEEKVKERTEQLEKAFKQLQAVLQKEQELNVIRSRFISLVSHEFRTPLTGIISSAEMLLKYGDRLPDKEQFLHKIRDLGKFLAEELTDFINVERLETGRFRLKLELLYLPGIVESIIQHLSHSYPDRHITTHFNPLPFPEFWLDRYVIRYILQNLLSNALKYSSPDSSVLLQVEYHPEEEEIHIAVTDQGIGIPEKDLPHIFEPFFRGENVKEHEGIGLGLSIVRQFVELSNGSITVESQEGKGTTFTVRIPAIKAVPELEENPIISEE